MPIVLFMWRKPLFFGAFCVTIVGEFSVFDNAVSIIFSLSDNMHVHITHAMN